MIQTNSLVAAAARSPRRETRDAGWLRRIVGDDVGLGLAIDVGDEVVAALAVDFQRIEARQAAHDQIAGAPRGAHADIEQWLHRLALE